MQQLVSQKVEHNPFCQVSVSSIFKFSRLSNGCQLQSRSGSRPSTGTYLNWIGCLVLNGNWVKEMTPLPCIVNLSVTPAELDSNVQGPFPTNNLRLLLRVSVCTSTHCSFLCSWRQISTDSYYYLWLFLLDSLFLFKVMTGHEQSPNVFWHLLEILSSAL